VSNIRMTIHHHHQKSRSRFIRGKIGVILTAASITGALTVNAPAFANTFDSSTSTSTQNPQDWQQVWQILALTGYVHLVYGTYMGRYGGMHTVAAWNIPVPRALQKISNNWGYSPYNPAFRSGLIQFERADHLLNRRGISRGRVTPEVLSALRAPIPKNRFPFQWIKVDKSTHPEHLQIWQVPPNPQGKGQWIYRTVVNTGVMHSTPDGSWPIYQRLAKTTMTGKFPIAVSPQQYHLLPASDRSIYHGYHVRLATLYRAQCAFRKLLLRWPRHPLLSAQRLRLAPKCGLRGGALQKRTQGLRPVTLWGYCFGHGTLRKSQKQSRNTHDSQKITPKNIA